METLILLLATLVILIALDRGDAAARALRRPDLRVRAVGVIAPPDDPHYLMIPATPKSPSQASPERGEPPRRGALSPPRRQPRRGGLLPRVVADDAVPLHPPVVSSDAAPSLSRTGSPDPVLSF